MSKTQKSCTLAALFVTATAWPAVGDVTPEEVWQNWQDTSAALGQTVVAGGTARDGDVLTIENVTIASVSAGTTMEASLAQIVMQDQGDGTVLVTMSPDYPVKMRLPPATAGQAEVELNILVTQDNLRMIASGAADAISYDVTAPSVKIKLDRIEGPAGQAANLTVDATLSDLAGTYSTKADEAGVSADTDISIAGLALAVVGSDLADASELRGTAAITGLEMQSSGTLMGAVPVAGMIPEMLAKADSRTQLSTQSTEFEMELAESRGTTSAKGTSGKGEITASMVGGVIDYAGSQQAMALTLNTPSIPVPDLAVTLDTYSFTVKAPLAPIDTALPFAFSINLANLALSDQIWALFDPSASLSRDPINLVIDTEGTTRMAAAMADGQGTMMPAELETLNLKQLRLSVAGAELTGAGSSTFAPSQGGVPNPDATLDFTLKGANELMDKLVASGLIEPQMLTMPRMMLAMVASPAADGSDISTSTIEIKDKSLSANGQILYQLE